MYIKKNNIILFLNLISIAIIMFLSPIITGKKLTLFLMMQIFISVFSEVFKKVKFKEILILFYISILALIYIMINEKIYFNSIFKIYELLLIIYFSFLNFKKCFSKENMEKVIRFICFIGVIISLYSIFEYITQSNPIFIRIFNSKYSNIYSQLNNNVFFVNTGIYRISASFQHPIIASNVGMFLAYITGLAYLVEKKRKYLIYLLLNLVMIYLTFSRSVFLAIGITLIIGIVIYLYIMQKTYSIKSYIKNISMLFFIFFIIGILINIPLGGEESILQSLINRFAQLFSESDKGSLYQRIYAMKYVADSISNNDNLFKVFLGSGFGTLAKYLIEHNITIFGKGYYVIDNQYFTLLYEVGIINLSLIGIIYIKNIINFITIVRVKLKNKFIINFIIGFLLIISFSIALFMYDGFTWVIICYLLGLSCAIVNEYKRKIMKFE